MEDEFYVLPVTPSPSEFVSPLADPEGGLFSETNRHTGVGGCWRLILGNRAFLHATFVTKSIQLFQMEGRTNHTYQIYDASSYGF